MMRGMGNMQGMMKQVQKLQKEMEAEKAVLKTKEFIGTAVNDLVKVTVNGDNQMIALEIKPELIDPEDPEMLTDLIMTATNQALEKAAIATEEGLGKYTKGLPGF